MNSWRWKTAQEARDKLKEDKVVENSRNAKTSKCRGRPGEEWKTIPDLKTKLDTTEKELVVANNS